MMNISHFLFKFGFKSRRGSGVKKTGRAEKPEQGEDIDLSDDFSGDFSDIGELAAEDFANMLHMKPGQAGHEAEALLRAKKNARVFSAREFKSGDDQPGPARPCTLEVFVNDGAVYVVATEREKRDVMAGFGSRYQAIQEKLEAIFHSSAIARQAIYLERVEAASKQDEAVLQVELEDGDLKRRPVPAAVYRQLKNRQAVLLDNPRAS